LFHSDILQPRRPSLLLSDFDGTITDRDFYQCALEYLNDPQTNLVWQRYCRQEIPMFQALSTIFARLPGDQAIVWQVALKTRVDPDVAQTVERLQAAGWDVAVVSHGCHWYIDRLLQHAGVQLPIIANPGELIAGQGLRMELPFGSPYFAAETGIDKGAVVADAQQRYTRVAFAGNSASDLEGAERVKEELRFARHQLARVLQKRNMAFRPFHHWSELADQLIDRA
jgi:2,3-diketo-5-methylthio-1-phosphopentane phosphatase